MTTDLLLAEADRLGIRLFAKEGGRLGFDAPAGAMSRELKDALVANKPEILDRLRGIATPAYHPRPLPWRQVVGRWPIPLRQTWGDRANALQDAGLSWHEAERVAFDEVREAARGATASPAGPCRTGPTTEIAAIRQPFLGSIGPSM